VDAAHRSIRWTARSSVTLFAAAFAASSLRRLWPVPWTGWLRRNRRILGLAFAFSHFTHLAAIVALGALAPVELDSRMNPVVLIGGGLAYAFIVAMALTSTDRAQTWRGGKPFRLLHTMGGYYVWLIFANSYLPRAAAAPAYLPAAALLVLVIGLRFAARLRMLRGR
jgi:DMSO/TMAO reductase YedYZ heme-binding membrane subunit